MLSGSDYADDDDPFMKESPSPQRAIMEEMEVSLGNFFLEDEPDHPRLKKIIEELETEGEQQRIKATLHVLAEVDANGERELRDALLKQLCDLREEHGVEVAILQNHTIGIYRSIKKAIFQRGKYAADIDELRNIKCKYLHSFLKPESFEFANPLHMRGIVQIPGLVAHIRQESKRIRSFSKHGSWEDEELGNFLPREKELQIYDLPEDQQDGARKQLVSIHVRGQFYRNIFLAYFDLDTYDPRDAEHYSTIFDWLLAIEETPHLFPFMQGQTVDQKHFRLAHLLNKIVQISELHQRIESVREDPTIGPELASCDKSRDCFKILANHRVAPLKVDRAFIGSTLLCPFSSFAQWVQDRLKDNDFTLPPESTSKSKSKDRQ